MRCMYFLLCLVLFTNLNTLYAQRNWKVPKHALGFQVGASSSQLRAENSGFPQYDGFFSGMLGGFYQYTPSPFIGFATGMNFYHRGGEVLSSMGSDSERLDMLVVGVPLLFQIRPASFVYFEIGPEFSVVTARKEQNYYEDLSYPFPEISLLLGLRFNLWKNLSIGAQYNHGLTAMKSFPAPPESVLLYGEEEAKYRSYAYTLSLRYLFEL